MDMQEGRGSVEEGQGWAERDWQRGRRRLGAWKIVKIKDKENKEIRITPAEIKSILKASKGKIG